MKKYWITWLEKHNKEMTVYRTFIFVLNRQQAKDIILIEQNYRKWQGLPHMFHVEIGQKCSNVSWKAKALYTMKEGSDQNIVSHIKKVFYERGVINNI